MFWDPGSWAGGEGVGQKISSLDYASFLTVP